jgi:hypothetical protein
VGMEPATAARLVDVAIACQDYSGIIHSDDHYDNIHVNHDDSDRFYS